MAGEVDFDLVVLGAGSAAFAAAIKGSEAGSRVALVEAGTLGRTCVNVGCEPSKALLRAGELYRAAGGAGSRQRLGGRDRRVDFTGLPRVTFTAPQIAGAGITEAEARAAGYDVRTSILPPAAVPRPLVNRDTRGLIKLVADGTTDRLLGASVVAESAGDVIQSAVLAIRFGITTTELAATFHPYLTMVEGLKLAAQTFTRDVARLSCCAS